MTQYDVVRIHLSTGRVLDVSGKIVEELPKILDEQGFRPVPIIIKNITLNISQIVMLEYLTKEQYEEKTKSERAAAPNR